jgi:hypothetical protein
VPLPPDLQLPKISHHQIIDLPVLPL